MFTGASKDSSQGQAATVIGANHDDKRKNQNSDIKGESEGKQDDQERIHHQTQRGAKDFQPRGSLSSANRLSGGGGGNKNDNVEDNNDFDNNYHDERQQFLVNNNTSGIHKKTNKGNLEANLARPGSSAASLRSTNSGGRQKRAKLAKQETLEGDKTGADCVAMFLNFVKRKRIFIPLIIISCIAAIYCIPFVEIETEAQKRLPHIPFNFRDGPLRESSASQFKIERLFKNQIYGPESVALDSSGNMYMAIEGGFILYAHLNKSSPLKSSYYFGDLPPPLAPPVRYSGLPNARLINNNERQQQQQQQQQQTALEFTSDLVKIAELNAIRQIPYNNNNNNGNQGARESANSISGSGGSWRRECQLDEKIYGPNLCTGGQPTLASVANDEFRSPVANDFHQNELASNEEDNADIGEEYELRRAKKFVSNVKISRCSKPLGIRLSKDEKYLYIVDTLNGLYRVNLMVAERPHSSQRLVTKLIDFRYNKHRLLPVVQLAQPPAGIQLLPTNEAPLFAATSAKSPMINNIANNNNNYANNAALMMRTSPPQPQSSSSSSSTSVNSVRVKTSYLNISLLAIDDLTIDYGAGTRGGDIIYLTDASQHWAATSFIYEMLEGRPTGVVLRYDTGSNQLSVLDPKLVNTVRTSPLEHSSQHQHDHHQSAFDGRHSYINNNTTTTSAIANEIIDEPYLGMGAPRLDENDIFDKRSLHFPNGLEITDDKQAILIADTINKRIIKHYIRGARSGTSDLWAWTPNYPDNIRRGFDKHRETYWVVGCGEDTTDKLVDMLDWLKGWPRLRKYILKNVYLFGWIIETIGVHVLSSTKVIDYGYSCKIGSTLLESSCAGMMILQYNKHGDIIRSIHSKEFPNDLAFYSQVDEVIDAKNQEHVLYLSSPSYRFVTKLTLPTDSFDLSPSTTAMP